MTGNCFKCRWGSCAENGGRVEESYNCSKVHWFRIAKEMLPYQSSYMLHMLVGFLQLGDLTPWDGCDPPTHNWLVYPVKLTLAPMDSTMIASSRVKGALVYAWKAPKQGEEGKGISAWQGVRKIVLNALTGGKWAEKNPVPGVKFLKHCLLT